MNKCQCGCGLDCKSKYKKGHARKNKPMSESHKSKISSANKGRKLTTEQIERIRLMNTGRKHTEEQKLNIKRIAKERGFGKWMVGKKLSKETICKIVKKRMENNYTHSDLTKIKISDANKGEKNGMFNKKHNEDKIKIISESSKSMWKNEESRSKILNTPNRLKNCRKGALVVGSKKGVFPFTNTIHEQLTKNILTDLKINFKHNYPIDKIEHCYCCDFYLPDFNVILEIDGSSHNKKKQKELDYLREKELNDIGLKLFRIKNENLSEITIKNMLNEITS